MRPVARLGAAAALAAGALLGGGCRTVVDTLAGVIGPGPGGEVIDAHVVYRLRPDCPTLLARTVDNGYTVLTPTGRLETVETVAALDDELFEESGLFEGPVRTGEVVFRYIPPDESGAWATTGVDVVARVEAVRLDLAGGHGRMVEICGPLVEGEAGDAVPRLPVQ